MRRDRRSKRDALKALLRLGDPAADDAGLTPADIDRMRGVVLAEAGARRPRIGGAVGRWVVATAVGTAAVVAALLWLQPAGDPKPLPPATAPLETARVPRVVPDDREPVSPTKDSAWGRPEPVEAPSATAIVATAPHAEQPAGPRKERTGTPRATTIRFTTRRGTQIIWTLDPRAEL